MAGSRDALEANPHLIEIVHDLKTPITSIMGFAELLQKRNFNEESTHEFYDIIASESKRLLMMVNELMYVPTSDKPSASEKCNITIQINKYAKELAPLAQKKNVEIVINTEGGDVYVSIPEEKISRILTNIIENAIKYNRDSGKVFVDVYEKNSKIFIKIKDTGIGIPQQDINKIFNKYYRSSTCRNMNISGFGLGLSIAKDITEAYGGTISASSKVGEGTEFTVSFPAENLEE